MLGRGLQGRLRPTLLRPSQESAWELPLPVAQGAGGEAETRAFSHCGHHELAEPSGQPWLAVRCLPVVAPVPRGVDFLCFGNSVLIC